MMEERFLLQVRNLRTYFHTSEGVVRAVDGVSFDVGRGDILGLAGESGCGKTTTALSIVRLIPQPGRIQEGNVIFDGVDLARISEGQLLRYRWKEISIVFQGAMNALNPVLTVERQIVEPITKHTSLRKMEARGKAEELLRTVGVDPSRIRSYPHELSGGMKQRVMIAMALAANPKLVILDEPVTALDVIVQAQILGLLRELQIRFGLSMILITHDLSVIAELCNKVAIMYAGRIVEYADAISLFDEPLHPYTQGLIASFPSIVGERGKLFSIPGSPPSLLGRQVGCRFAPRCPSVQEVCRKREPPLVKTEDGRFVECHIHTNHE